MFKEIKDVKGVCGNIISKLGDIKDICTKMNSIMDDIEAKAGQEEAVNVTLTIRKQLAKLFILNSNVEDNFDTLRKVFDSLEENFLEILNK